jgi:hypothetical protein
LEERTDEDLARQQVDTAPAFGDRIEPIARFEYGLEVRPAEVLKRQYVSSCKLTHDTLPVVIVLLCNPVPTGASGVGHIPAGVVPEYNVVA